MPGAKARAESAGGAGLARKAGGLLSVPLEAIRNLVKALIILTTIALIAFSITHWFKGLDLVSTLKADVDDTRVLANCPLKLGNLSRFVARSESQQAVLRWLQAEKQDWVMQVCTGDIWNVLGQN